VLEAVQDGILDVGLPAYLFEPAKLPLHNWTIFVPFGSADPQQVARIGMAMHDRFPYLTEVLEKRHNQKFLGINPITSYHLITNFPWKKLEDLKGRKIAAAGPNLIYVKSVGAVPVQSNLNEAYTSLQTGVYDGWLMFVDATVGFKLYEVAKYHTFCDFGSIVAAAVTINLDRWKGLPKEVQEIIQAVGREYVEDVVKAELVKHKGGLDMMKKAGVEFYTLPFEEKVRWANMLPNIPDQKAKEADAKGMPGSKLYKAYIAELEKDGYKFPRRWDIK
jgi:TRAP-type C4-dicarboxylate transport system substrate-binding protein